MGKRKDQPPLADWEVRLLTGSTVVVAQAWHERVKRDYVFHDETGICYTFPVRTVAYIARADEPIAHSGFGGGGEYAAETQTRVWSGTVGTGGAGGGAAGPVTWTGRSGNWHGGGGTFPPDATSATIGGDYSEAAR